jgi:hypothetical protein
MTTWRSDVYHLLQISHVQIEVEKKSVRNLSFWNSTVAGIGRHANSLNEGRRSSVPERLKIVTKHSEKQCPSRDLNYASPPNDTELLPLARTDCVPSLSIRPQFQARRFCIHPVFLALACLSYWSTHRVVSQSGEKARNFRFQFYCYSMHSTSSNSLHLDEPLRLVYLHVSKPSFNPWNVSGCYMHHQV